MCLKIEENLSTQLSAVLMDTNKPDEHQKCIVKIFEWGNAK